jgi:hypothetical protein
MDPARRWARVEPRLVRAHLVLVVVLLAWSAVAGCSDGEPPVYPWPEVHGYDIYEGATAEAGIDALIVGSHQAFGDEYAIERTIIYTIADVEERDRLQADHGALLQNWEFVGSRTSLVRTWERGEQRFTLVFVTLDDQRVAVSLATRRR